MISLLLNKEVQQFIKDHRHDDPLLLALQAKKYPHLPIQLISQQIQSWQKAKTKLPEFVKTEGIIYPPAVSLEQSSSQHTAIFKSRLFSGNTMADLTGGFGIDSYYFSKSFRSLYYVERNPDLCEIVKHNFNQLKADNVEVLNMDAETFLQSSVKVDLIYIDPARRGESNQKLYKLADCEPDIIRLHPLLIEKGKKVLIKTSPMLDIEEAVSSMDQVKKVIILAVENECKEVLYLLSSEDKEGNNMIDCINIKKDGSEQRFSFSREDEHHVALNLGEVQNYLYEPNAAILKAGAFKTITRRYPVQKLHINSHLYTSNALVNDFPGRIFKVVHIVAYNKKEVDKLLQQKKANITTRNFPEGVKEIYRKLGLKEGGDSYLFATTDVHQKLRILITEKVQ